MPAEKAPLPWLRLILSAFVSFPETPDFLSAPTIVKKHRRKNHVDTVFRSVENTLHTGYRQISSPCNIGSWLTRRCQHAAAALARISKWIWGLLLLMAAAEIAAFLIIGSLRTSDAQLERRFLQRSRILEQIRSSIYLSGTVARDFLLAPAPGRMRSWPI